MSTNSVSTAPNVAARATSPRSVAARPLACQASKRSRRPSQLGGVERVEDRAGGLGQLGGGHLLRVARDAVGEQVRVAVHGAVDRVQRLGGGEDERQAEAGERGLQRAVDLARVRRMRTFWPRRPGCDRPARGWSGRLRSAARRRRSRTPARPPRPRSGGRSSARARARARRCGNVTARSSGLTWKRSAVWARLSRRFGSRKRLQPCPRWRTRRGCARAAVHASGSSARSSSSSLSPPACAARFLNSIRAASASCGSGLVGR